MSEFKREDSVVLISKTGLLKIFGLLLGSTLCGPAWASSPASTVIPANESVYRIPVKFSTN